MADMLLKYEAYLEKLGERLDGYFDAQKEFIKCRPGCSICCENSYYPVSELEYRYMKIGIDENFDNEKMELLNRKSIQIIKDRTKFLKTNPNSLEFSYKCPFLFDNSCSIYNYRALLCRAHGLLFKDADDPNRMHMPYCLLMGYNYANIWNEQDNTLSEEKAVSLGLKTRPEAFDTSYSALIQQADGIEFGDIRMVVEWIVMDIPGWQELIRTDN